MTPSDDEILEALSALPRHDAEQSTVERIRRAALAEYRGGALLAAAPRAPVGFRTRVVEPLLVVASVVSYLTWTASTLAEVHAASSAVGEIGERGASGAR